MDPEQSHSRLSRIETHWSVVRRAHETPDHESADRRRSDALSQLWNQYRRAVRRYLARLLSDRSHPVGVADDLTQQFGLRLSSGSFENVAPDQGRFRDYLKQCLRNLIADYFRSLPPPTKPLTEDVQAPAVTDEEFRTFCREEAILKALEELAQVSETHHHALTLRMEQPDLDSDALAERISLSSVAFRVALHRARVSFARILIRNVRNSLSDPSLLAEELADLGLLKYCRPFLPKQEA